MDDSSANLPKSMEDAIKSVVGKSIPTLSNNMTKVLDDSVHSIKRQINEDNETLIEKVVKKARREDYHTFKKTMKISSNIMKKFSLPSKMQRPRLKLMH